MLTQETVSSAEASSSEAKTLPRNKPINRDRYSMRILEMTFGDSKSSGNPMLTMQAEIYAPDKIISKIDGKEYSVAGLKGKAYFTLTPSAVKYLIGDPNDASLPGLMPSVGLKPIIDEVNPDTEQFKGKCFSIIVTEDEQTMRKQLSEAEKAAGQKQGEPILDESGNPEIGYGIKLDTRSIRPTTKVAPAF